MKNTSNFSVNATCVAAILFALLCCCGPSKLQTAEHCVSIGDFTTAVRIYQEVLQRKPMDFRARLGIAHAYYSLAAKKGLDSYTSPEQGIGEWEQVVNAFEIVHNIDTAAGYSRSLGNAYYNLGVFLRQAKRFGDAGQAFLKSLCFDSLDGDIYNQLGAVYFKMNRVDEAREVFALGIAADSTNGRLWFNYSLASIHMHDTAAACRTLDKALLLLPSHTSAARWRSRLKCMRAHAEPSGAEKH